MGGVVGTIVGYTGGTTPSPTYARIGDHTEALRIEFDPKRISYEDLLIEWSRMHRPTHYCKAQYRSAVWFLDEEQKEMAEKVVSGMKDKLSKREKLYTSVEPTGAFYRAEEYHQQYMSKKREK